MTKPDEPEVSSPTRSGMTRAELIVTVLIIVVLVAFLIPAIYASREASRRMASSNNLKVIALALHNYESAYQRLPSGCDAGGKHGWTTYVSPFLEASAWYNKVDYDVSWEHALNRHHFGAVTSTFRIPNGGPYYTSEGFGITNYLGNPSVLHRASFVKFSDISAGLQHVWLAGEV
jgi:type II secretory pathway pseudopilin PulG